jgi:hypothetical protein
MPPLAHVQRNVRDHGVEHFEGDLAGLGIAEGDSTVMPGTDVIKAIVAAPSKIDALVWLAARAIKGLGFSTSAKTTPNINRFDPANQSGRGFDPQLQHVVSSTRAFVGALGTIAIDAGAGFAKQPAAMMTELKAQLIGMDVGR